MGIFSTQLVATEQGDLFLLGGQDGFQSYNSVYAYHEEYGFYEIDVKLPNSIFDFVALTYDSYVSWYYIGCSIINSNYTGNLNVKNSWMRDPRYKHEYLDSR